MEETYEPIFDDFRPLIYAGFSDRALARMLDILVLMLLGMLIVFFIPAGNAFEELYHGQFHFNSIIVELIDIVISWLYFSIFQSSKIQATPGKMAFGIIVTDLNGGRITFKQATLRHCTSIISGLILLIGYFMNLWDPKGQTLHDKIAGTLVIKRLHF